MPHREIPPRLAATAAAHHGVLTTRDAAAAEVDANALVALVSAGLLVHVRRGAYVLGDLWAVASPELRLALRVRAILRQRGAGAATHQSALALYGLPLHGVEDDVVDVSGDVARVRRRSGLRVHPDRDLRAWTIDGCAALGVADALAQVALRSGRDAVLVPADAALHRGLTDRAALRRAVDELADGPRAHARCLRWLRSADAASESVGETRSRLLLGDLGFAVRSQVRVPDPSGRVVARVDLLVGDRVVVEFDGLVKYEGAAGRAALAAEKHREDTLRALGYEVVRLTWADLDHPQRVHALVTAALRRAASAPRIAS